MNGTITGHWGIKDEEFDIIQKEIYGTVFVEASEVEIIDKLFQKQDSVTRLKILLCSRAMLDHHYAQKAHMRTSQNSNVVIGGLSEFVKRIRDEEDEVK